MMCEKYDLRTAAAAPAAARPACHRIANATTTGRVACLGIGALPERGVGPRPVDELSNQLHAEDVVQAVVERLRLVVLHDHIPDMTQIKRLTALIIMEHGHDSGVCHTCTDLRIDKLTTNYRCNVCKLHAL
eukprot:scaffold657247_cov59-Prasinocladus_malaysianus.AAC.1